MLWDHDVFGMKDFLGSVTFALDDIRRYSALDAPQWFQLHGAKTGSVELKIKVISDVDSEVSRLLSHFKGVAIDPTCINIGRLERT